MRQKIEIINNGNTRIITQSNNYVTDKWVGVKQELNCITTEIRKREKKFNSLGLASRYIKNALDIERRRGSEITMDCRLPKNNNHNHKRKHKFNHKPKIRMLGYSTRV